MGRCETNPDHEPIDYCDACSTCHACMEKYVERLIDGKEKATAHNSKLLAENRRLKEALRDTKDNAYDPDYIFRIVDAALEGGDE